MVILGKDGKEYKSVKECIAADELFEKKIAEEKAAKEAAKREEELKIATKKAEISKRKKELAEKIDVAKKAVDDAKIAYKKAEEEAATILSEAYKMAQDILNEANASLKSATKAKMEAISEFNKEFGYYTTVLTGKDAWDEYQDVSNTIKSIFDWMNSFRF